MDLFKKFGETFNPNITKARIVVMSHLSDANELILQNKPIEANIKINFIKYVILHCTGDLTQEIDANKLYNEYINIKTR